MKNHLLRPFTASALVPFRPQLPCLPAWHRAGNDPKTWASWGSWPGSTTGSACQVRTGKFKIKHFHGEKKCSNQEIYSMSRAACQVFWMISRVYYVYDYVYIIQTINIFAMHDFKVTYWSLVSMGCLSSFHLYAAKGRSFTGSVSMNSSIFGKQSSSTCPPENMNEMVIYQLHRTQLTSIFEGQPSKTRPNFQPKQAWFGF